MLAVIQIGLRSQCRHASGGAWPRRPPCKGGLAINGKLREARLPCRKFLERLLLMSWLIVPGSSGAEREFCTS
jgi:hypothetical protein